MMSDATQGDAWPSDPGSGGTPPSPPPPSPPSSTPIPSSPISAGPVGADAAAIAQAINAENVKKSAKGCGCLFGPLGILFVVGMIAAFTAVLGVVWPGVYKLTAPIMCPSGYDDPFVVRDTSSVRPGETSTSFTMYCLNERGEAENVGIFKPMLLVAAAAVVGLLLLVGVIMVLGAVKRRSRGEPTGSAYS